jgi:charged multivesicular body protein 6
MLGGRISNQDEDEVEEELEAMEAELLGVSFPEVTTAELPMKVRVEAAQEEREEQRAGMLA